MAKKVNMVLSLSLSEDQYRYLGELSRKAKETGGRKLKYTEILRSLIRLVKKLNIKLSDGIKDENQLVKCLLENVKKYKKN